MEAAHKATAADLPRIVELACLAREELGAQRGGEMLLGALPDEREEALARRMSDPSRLVVVGTIDAAVMGYATARLAAVGARSVGVIEEIFVEAAARGVGVGEAMLNRVVAWCREAGCRALDANALPGNRAAKTFFEDNGFVTRLLVVQRDLDDRPG